MCGNHEDGSDCTIELRNGALAGQGKPWAEYAVVKGSSGSPSSLSHLIGTWLHKVMLRRSDEVH